MFIYRPTPGRKLDRCGADYLVNVEAPERRAVPQSSVFLRQGELVPRPIPRLDQVEMNFLNNVVYLRKKPGVDLSNLSVCHESDKTFVALAESCLRVTILVIACRYPESTFILNRPWRSPW